MQANRNVSLRTLALLVASWILIGFVSGRAVYLFMLRHQDQLAEGELVFDERGDPVLHDPSALALQDDLAFGRQGLPMLPKYIPPLSRNEDPGELSAFSAEPKEDNPVPEKKGLAVARALEREELRLLFRDIMEGTATLSSLTPKLIAELTMDDLTAALDRVREMPWSLEANQLTQNLLRRMGELDPASAMMEALSLDGNRAASTAIRDIWRAWDKQDPQAALSWYFDNLDAEAARLAPSLRTVFSSLASVDPAGALIRAWQLPAAMSRQALRAIVSQSVKDGSLEAMQQVVQSLAPGLERTSMISALVQEYAVYQPTEAVRWINLLDDELSRNRSVNQLVSIWGFDNPVETAEWVARLPAGALQGQAAATLIRNWSGTEPADAARWLNSLPASPQLDFAFRNYVWNIMADEPALAMGYVERIENSLLRKKLALQVGTLWSAENPQAAQSYFQASAWDPDIRNRFQ